MNDREQFCILLAAQPILRADAIVLLAGEDGEARMEVAAHLWGQGAAGAVVVTGGLEDPPRILGAASLLPRLLGKGIAPDAVLDDVASGNTREQAAFVVDLAKERGWHRLLLVASPYHQFRAYLTFLQALTDRDMEQSVHLLSVPASQTRWGERIPGTERTRLMALQEEFVKVEDYRERGHVADYRHGIDYLLWWEGVKE